MPIAATSPCHESWSALTPSGDGRYCQKCDKTVVDLTQLTRRQAERVVQQAGGSMCGRMRVGPSGAPVFRRELERAPGLLSVAAASLLAACGSTDTESSSATGVAASVETPSTGGDHLLRDDGTGVGGSLASPMMPLADDRIASTEPAPVTTIAAVAVDEGDESVVPTDDQRALTEHKEEERRPTRTARRRSRGADPVATVSTTTPGLGGRRHNGGAPSSITAPIAPPAVNNPPEVYMGGISFTP